MSPDVATAQPVITPPEGGDAMQGPVGGLLTIKLRAAQTAGRIAVIENVVAPAAGPPLHFHHDQDETWFVADGTLRFRIGDEISHAPQGSWAFVPRGIPHCFQNIGGTPACIHVAFNPAGTMEHFFEQMAAITPEQAENPDTFVQLGHPHGMEVVGPPLARSHPLDA